MGTEILFNEEVEPPGSLTDLIGPEPNPTHCPSSKETGSSLPDVRPETGARLSAFRDSPRSQAFRRRFFPGVSLTEWFDWRWQLRHRIRDLATLGAMVCLSDEEYRALARPDEGLPVAVTPYYASLLDPFDPSQPIRRTVVPVADEFQASYGEAADPLAEEGDSPVPGLVHRYPDRVLFLATGFCSTYCRYCTRSRLVGHDHGVPAGVDHWRAAIAYIETHTEVRDVLLSGGDPLTLPDDMLAWLLGRLRSIRHVELLRIGTKVPVVMPQRITPALARLLRRLHPLWMSIHVTHPDELSPEMEQACQRLADAGIPLGSQTVLLAGINDRVETMKRLFHGLLKIRVKPYYLYQCDPIPGSAHFRTPVCKGLEIIEGLRGHTTGYAVPSFVVDAPGGGGKIALLPESIAGRSGDDLLLRNYEGKIFRYPDGMAVRRDVH